MTFDRDTQDQIFRAACILFLFIYLLFTLLINASWFCGALIRCTNFIVFLISWHLTLKTQVLTKWLATGTHVALFAGAIIVIEAVTYLQVRS